MMASDAAGQNTVAIPDATPISSPPQQCAEQTAQAADDNGNEARHDQRIANCRLQPSMPAANTPARPAR